jgi:hypothetical protein
MQQQKSAQKGGRGGRRCGNWGGGDAELIRRGERRRGECRARAPGVIRRKGGEEVDKAVVGSLGRLEGREDGQGRELVPWQWSRRRGRGETDGEGEIREKRVRRQWTGSVERVAGEMGRQYSPRLKALPWVSGGERGGTGGTGAGA